MNINQHQELESLANMVIITNVIINQHPDRVRER